MAKKMSKKTTAARTTKTGAKTTNGKTGATSAKAAKTAKPAKTTKVTKARSTSAAKSKTVKKKATRTTAAKAAVSTNGNGHSNGHRNGNGSLAAGRTTAAVDDRFTDSLLNELSDDELRAVKTGLTRKDLDYFRDMLLEKRAEIVGNVQGMQDARNSATSGDISHMPLHMADVGSDNYEQEFTLGLMESERKLVIEIDHALDRIQKQTYGVCMVSGTPIPRARLEIKPWAKYCIEVARERERRGLSL